MRRNILSEDRSTIIKAYWKSFCFNLHGMVLFKMNIFNPAQIFPSKIAA